MLVNCIVYQDGKKVSDIAIENISDYLERPGYFVWVALRDANAAELTQMQDEFALHALAVEDASHGHQRPKIEEYGTCLFAVVHIVEWVNGQLHVGEINIFVEKDYVLSIRNHSDKNLLSVRARCENEPHLLKQGPAFVFYALMDAVVDRYFPIVDTLESELEAIEEQIFIKGSERSNIERLYQLKRQAIVLKHAIAPLMEAVAKLYGARAPAICVGTQEYFRDIYDHLYRLNTSVDTIRDTIATAIQANMSMVTIEESEVSKRLAAWAAIFAVATAFTGIWGMNFKMMPELDWLYGYPVALSTIGTICGYLYYRLRKSGWL